MCPANVVKNPLCRFIENKYLHMNVVVFTTFPFPFPVTGELVDCYDGIIVLRSNIVPGLEITIRLDEIVAIV